MKVVSLPSLFLIHIECYFKFIFEIRHEKKYIRKLNSGFRNRNNARKISLIKIFFIVAYELKESF